MTYGKSLADNSEALCLIPTKHSNFLQETENLLVDIQEEACLLGVEISLSVQRKHIWIEAIERWGGKPGNGAIVLATLIDSSDSLGLPIYAAVSTEAPRLLQYYQDLGFEILHDHCPDGLLIRKSHLLIEYMP